MRAPAHVRRAHKIMAAEQAAERVRLAEEQGREADLAVEHPDVRVIVWAISMCIDWIHPLKPHSPLNSVLAHERWFQGYYRPLKAATPA